MPSLHPATPLKLRCRVPPQEAPILLCDEATSALDSKTERDILEALQQLAAGRTSLFVAHRLSTAAQADKIVVLDQVPPQAAAPPELLEECSSAPASRWSRCWLAARQLLASSVFREEEQNACLAGQSSCVRLDSTLKADWAPIKKASSAHCVP